MHRSIVKKIVGYHGQFRVSELDFNEKWGNINTPDYDILASEVGMQVCFSTCSYLVCLSHKEFTQQTKNQQNYGLVSDVMN